MILGVVTLVITTLLYVVLQFTILQGFSSLENNLVEQSVQRISNSLDSYFKFLYAKTGDWARWDATYEFVENQNDQYIRENLVADAFSTLDINFAVYFNRDGKMVYSYALDLTQKKDMPIKQDILDGITKLHDKFENQKNMMKGYLMVPGNAPMIFVSYPIRHSDGSGPDNGTLLFARYFDQSILQQLTQSTIFPLEIKNIESIDMSADFIQAKNELLQKQQDYVALIPKDQQNYKNNTIEGYVLFRDFFGNPAFMLKIGVPREIHKNAESAVFYVLVFVVFAGIVFMVTAFLFTEKLVLKRLLFLRKNIHSVSESNYQSTRSIILPGSDEIFFLSWEIQNMLERLVIAETDLRTSNQRYRGIVESQHEFIVRYDIQGKIIFANDAYQKKFEKNEAALLGENFMPPAYQDDLVSSQEILKKVSTAPYRFSKEQRVQTREGLRWIFWEYYAIRDQKGDVIEVQHVGRDITREKNVDTMKSEFVSLASHQLRTPLTGIKWFADLLLRKKAGELTATQIDFLEQIANSNERMIKLVNNLLDISTIETGTKFQIQRSLTTFGSMLRELTQEDLVTSQEKHINFFYDRELFEKLILNVDGQKIRQVFQNFLSNALKYSPPNTTIEVGCTKEKDAYVFFVRDHGVGIPLDQQNRVFEKFFRAQNVVTMDTLGTGLGLYITKAIVERHGGKVWFTSEAGKGSVFYFSIPFKGNLPVDA